jgi:hypothetical protein
MLEYVSIPRSVTAIGENAFYRCASLRTIQLPPTLKSIGSRAFSNCISLTSVILPGGVRVEENAFHNCTALRTVYALGRSSKIDPSAFRTSSRDLVIYAQNDTAGYHAAAANDLLWAEIDGTPQRLYDPGFIQAAVLHDEETSGLLPLYAETDETSDVLGWYPVGVTAASAEKSNAPGWAYVEVDQAKGYMPLSALRFIGKEDVVERILQLSFPGLLYATPSRDAPTIAADKARYNVIQRFGTWYLIEANGSARYVPVEDVDSHSMNMAAPDRLFVVTVKGNGSRAHLYASPDKYSESLGVYYNGTQVIVLVDDHVNIFPTRTETGTINGFYPVQVEGQQGSMEASALSWTLAVWAYAE